MSGQEAELWQLNMFGPPEPVSSYGALSERGRNDDAPVPSERENLWPSDLVKHLGVELLERLYGDIPRRTRLKTREVCRRLRVDSNTVHNRIKQGSFDAVNVGMDNASNSEWRIYRYSVVSWLFNREFRDDTTRGAHGLAGEDLDRIMNAVQARSRRR